MSISTLTQQKINDPQTLPDICAHVANGGSILSLCEMWQVPYSQIIKWVITDDGRRTMYNEACAAQSEWVVQRVLLELRNLSFVDIRRIFGQNHELLPVAEWPKEIAAAVAGIEVAEEFEGVGLDRTLIGYTKKVKLVDKIKAMELIGKNLKLFTDRIEHSGKVTLEDLIVGSNKSKPASDAI